MKTRIHFCVPHSQAAGPGAFYRMVQPYRYLAAGRRPVRLGAVPSRRDLKRGDVFVFYKFANAFLQEAALAAKAQGKTIVYDLDEMLLAPPAHHPEFESYFHDTPILRQVRRCLREASVVTVPTPYMAQALTGHAYKVKVVPTFIGRGLLAPEGTANRATRAGLGIPDDGLVIGWTGDRSNHEDLLLVKLALERLLARLPGVYLLAIGYDPAFDVPGERVRVCRPETVEDRMRLLDLVDIGVVPLADTFYNRCRPAVAAMEFGARGVPVIASPVLPHEEAARDGAPVILAAKISEWEDRLLQLLEDADARAALGSGLRGFVEANWLLEENMAAFHEAWGVD